MNQTALNADNLPYNYASHADEIIRHIESQIDAAPLQLKPYPYLVVPDLMPQDFYELAQYFSAKGTAYICADANKNNEARFSGRQGFQNSPLLSEEAEEFWNFFRNTVCVTVNRALVKKMQVEIHHYMQWLHRHGLINKYLGGTEIGDSALQVLERVDSRVGVHHHAICELLSNLIYMPEDDRMADSGTWIDRMTGIVRIVSDNLYWLSWRPPFFQKANTDRLMTYDLVPKFMSKQEKQIQFLPNTLLSILNTPWSLHSQTTLHKEKRYFLLFSATIGK